MSAYTQDKVTWPEVLPGFDHVSRMWDVRAERCAAKILPGEYYVTGNDEMITTVLGSCVSACVRDPYTGFGGMNHFMLPGNAKRCADRWGGSDGMAARYGKVAMEMMINEVLKHGGIKNRLELKLFGGGQVLVMDVNNVGDRNIEFAREYAEQEGYIVAAEDMGGEYPRKVNYFPKTGRVMVRRLRALQNKGVAEQERNYRKLLAHKEKSHEFDLLSA